MDINVLLLEFLRVLTMVSNVFYECRRYLFRREGMISEYYLSFDGTQVEEETTRVPEECVHVQVYMTDGLEKRAVVTYEGEEIVYKRPTSYVRIRSPWLWIGDSTTETSLTEALQMYHVPGNKIHYDLLVHLMKFNENTKIQYLHPRTLQMVDFPEEGIVIEADE